MLFANRTTAGRRLAGQLFRYAACRDVLVLALPRGGVPVAYEIALALRAQLDVLNVRKVTLPGQEAVPVAVVASGGVLVPNEEVLATTRVPQAVVEFLATKESEQITRDEATQRRSLARSDAAGKTVILVDDGLRVGATMRGAVRAIRREEPERVIVAVPVASKDAREMLAHEADEMVCLATPDSFPCTRVFYSDFAPVTDDEVRNLLEDAAGRELRTA